MQLTHLSNWSAYCTTGCSKSIKRKEIWQFCQKAANGYGFDIAGLIRYKGKMSVKHLLRCLLFCCRYRSREPFWQVFYIRRHTMTAFLISCDCTDISCMHCLLFHHFIFWRNTLFLTSEYRWAWLLFNQIKRYFCDPKTFSIKLIIKTLHLLKILIFIIMGCVAFGCSALKNRAWILLLTGLGGCICGKKAVWLHRELCEVWRDVTGFNTW